MTQNEHVYAICCRPEIAGGVISDQNVKTIEGYVMLNFEAASISSFPENNKMPTNWFGRQNAASLKFDPKPSNAVGRFSNFGKCRSKVAGDVISDVAVK